MPAGYSEFQLDLPLALLGQLIGHLDVSEAAGLTPENIAQIPGTRGVYQLLLDDQLVYVGKADAAGGLKGRLEEHISKVQHRIGLDPANMSFKAVHVIMLDANVAEGLLIDYYDSPWNHSGFGSHDPGRRRDTQEPPEFDRKNPIDIDREVWFPDLRNPTAGAVLRNLASLVPYTFRFERSNADRGTRVRIPEAINRTARTLIAEVVRQLPSGWQAVVFPSHVILYKNNTDYANGTVFARSP